MRRRSERASAASGIVAALAAVPLSAALLLRAGAHSVAKPGRLPWANEDACFVAPPCLAVFDGVSAAPRSRDYAATLARSVRAGLRQGDDLRQALRRAANTAAHIRGASTACVVRFDFEHTVVSCFNLGDSGFMLLSPPLAQGGSMRIVGHSTQQAHAGGAPFQLAGAAGISDSVSSGAQSSYALDAGQVALCFTDGLSRNLNARSIAEIVAGAPQLAPNRLARLLVEEATRRGSVQDDITVVVGRIL